MADRGIFRVATRPLDRAGAELWAKFITQLLPGPHFKATALGQPIARLVLGDPDQAFAMYAGNFNFAGHHIKSTAHRLFKLTNGAPSWRTALHNLVWLQHFVASNRNLHAHFAMRLLGRWAKAAKAKTDVNTTAKILLALTVDGPALARQCETLLQTEFLDIATKQTKRLWRKSAKHPQSALLKAIALLHAATAFRGLESLRKPASDMLHDTIDKVILPDGGHMSRNPYDVLALLALLVPLKAAMKRDRQVFPHAASQAIERMQPMLAMMQHGDGGLTGFQNNAPELKLMEALQGEQEALTRPLNIARHSNYARLAEGKSCLLVDTVHGCELEFSDGSQRLFRTTSLHQVSTEAVQLRQVSQGSLLHLAQGASERTFYLSHDGCDLRVEDIHNSASEIIFEIDPSVKLTTLRESTSILLVTPDRVFWQLSFRGGEALIEKNGAVIKLLSSSADTLNWAFKKQAKSPKPASRKSTPEPDLLQ
jgi:uncharacterized heparinase superfamily protein